MKKLLGILDLGAAIVLFLAKSGSVTRIGWAFAIYLILKSIFFFPDVGSIIDGLAGLVLIFAAFGMFGFLSYVAIVWLILKGIWSLFG
ncbi:MAG: hypothetical protein PHT54_00050 [Candidatus Nanoarchaeia archaeon]|nr:hypothetical protein [Candidatus Nanoarchaeia archaeon]